MASKQPKTTYENNPFFIATNGITLLFDLARGVAAVMIIFSVLSFFISGPDRTDDTNYDGERFMSTVSGWTPEQWALAIATVAIIGLAFIMISALFAGVSAYASAQIAKGKAVPLGEAFRTAFDHLWSFVWLQVIIFIKVLLWTLLFIIPGIYFSIRYSLAGVAFYDTSKNLRGNAAIKESLKLTKNGWITTFGSNMIFNLLTLGVLGSLVSTGVNAILYQQFEKVGDKKPAAHWLSWLSLFLPAIVIIFILIFVIALGIGLTLGGEINP